VTFLTVSVFLSVVSSLICSHLLFRSSSFHPCVSGHLQKYARVTYVRHFSCYLIWNKFLAIYNDQPVLYVELIILYSASEATHKYNATKNVKFSVVVIPNVEHQVASGP
jgi:hypothetical protein